MPPVSVSGAHFYPVGLVASGVPSYMTKDKFWL